MVCWQLIQPNSCCSNSPPGPADPSSPEDGPSVLCILEHRHIVTDCLCNVMEVMTNSIIKILLYLPVSNCSLSNVSFPTRLLPTPCGFEGKQREDLDYIINERCSSNYIVLDYLYPFPYWQWQRNYILIIYNSQCKWFVRAEDVSLMNKTALSCLESPQKWRSVRFSSVESWGRCWEMAGSSSSQ